MDHKVMGFLVEMKADIMIRLDAMQNRLENVELDTKEMNTHMSQTNQRLEFIDNRLDGIGGQFEMMTSQKIEQTRKTEEDLTFVISKVANLEREVYHLKKQQ
ncbi:hypothetical protein [Jeotgalibacillus salarius]|uniref:Uncharacterized protein n=1 Tax=Jeotgalibacillus salarius TaxID=546023 RepID=A0A4Y8LND7_9BACL|nr:hypothetical protein [Jeotgalibacillus salarius]TFE03927.1 hypothetical protein E2626_00960 [Jeotgalibacillus salarius]